jgi:hypothetical protein
MRKRVYIAGPYSADNVMDVLRNIAQGVEVAARLLDLGFAPYCSWLDFQLVLERPMIPKSAYYELSLAWLTVSDAVLLVGDWQRSVGVAQELEWAARLGIPVFDSLDALMAWEKGARA